MNRLLNTLVKLTLCLMLVFPGYITSVKAAAPDFEISGEIFEIKRQSINVNDHFFPVISTVKVSIPGKKKAAYSDLKKGDFVRALVQKYNGKYYVDSIYYLTEDPNKLKSYQ